MTIHVPPLDCEWSDPISASLQRHPIADLTAPARFARYRRIDRIYAEFPRVDEDRGICRRQLRGANQAKRLPFCAPVQTKHWRHCDEFRGTVPGSSRPDLDP